jgi:hypothetical protein
MSERMKESLAENYINKIIDQEYEIASNNAIKDKSDKALNEAIYWLRLAKDPRPGNSHDDDYLNKKKYDLDKDDWPDKSGDWQGF